MFDARLFLIGFLQALFVLLLAPFFAGLARVLRAKMHSRKGPPLFQYYYDIIKLMKRQEVRPAQATWVFRATPYMIMVSVLLIAALIPMWVLQSPFGVVGDMILVIYLFAMVRFFLAMSGFDSGSGFAQIGVARELALGVLVEPAIMLVLFIIALFAGSTNLGTMSQMIALGEVSYTSPAIWLGMAAFAVASFIETGKLPFDLAEAEQEVQEGPLTEYSGPGLALLKWGIFAKQVVVLSLFLAIFFPFGSAATPGLPGVLGAAVLFFLKLFCLYVVVAVVENSMARLTLFRAPHITWVALGIALLSFVFYLVQI